MSKLLLWIYTLPLQNWSAETKMLAQLFTTSYFINSDCCCCNSLSIIRKNSVSDDDDGCGLEYGPPRTRIQNNDDDHNDDVP